MVHFSFVKVVDERGAQLAQAPVGLAEPEDISRAVTAAVGQPAASPVFYVGEHVVNLNKLLQKLEDGNNPGFLREEDTCTVNGAAALILRACIATTSSLPIATPSSVTASAQLQVTPTAPAAPQEGKRKPDKLKNLRDRMRQVIDHFAPVERLTHFKLKTGEEIPVSEVCEPDRDVFNLMGIQAAKKKCPGQLQLLDRLLDGLHRLKEAKDITGREIVSKAHETITNSNSLTIAFLRDEYLKKGAVGSEASAPAPKKKPKEKTFDFDQEVFSANFSVWTEHPVAANMDLEAADTACGGDKQLLKHFAAMNPGFLFSRQMKEARQEAQQQKQGDGRMRRVEDPQPGRPAGGAAQTQRTGNDTGGNQVSHGGSAPGGGEDVPGRGITGNQRNAGQGRSLSNAMDALVAKAAKGPSKTTTTKRGAQQAPKQAAGSTTRKRAKTGKQTGDPPSEEEEQVGTHAREPTKRPIKPPKRD